jgi:hypothetical protein
MKTHKIYNRLATCLFPCLLALLLSSPAWAEPAPKAVLMLQKKDPYLYGPCGWCTDLFSLKENDDRKNFSRYNLDTQTGYYLVDLIGPAGTTVTLFGSQNFLREHGYLILVKQDDRPIAVGDLKNLPPHQWVDVNQSDTGPGLYRLWYHPSANFKERIASVRWGQWWSQLPPMNEKE